MKSLKKTTQIFLTLFFLISLAGCSALGGSQASGIQASGVIEATEIAVSPQLSGRVVQVSAEEGDTVKAGDELLRLDDNLLQAQRKVAVATLDSARSAVQSAQASLDTATAQYQMALDAARASDQPSRTIDWSQPISDTFQQPAWYFTQDEQIQAAQEEVTAAQAAVQKYQDNLDKVIKDLDNADFLGAEKRLADARVAYNVADEVYRRSQASNPGELITAAKDALDNAKTELANAQKAYDDMLSTQSAADVLKARAELSVAQERNQTAQDTLRSLQTGELAPQVVAAQKVVQQAQDGLLQAQNGVSQAEAQLGLIDAQIQELTLSAPMDGVVLTRSIQPGEVIQAGMTALTIGELNQLKVTVYIPEDLYGQIHLGDHANLSVDSFPGETFDAVVTRIADQAEYTPRNVQTQQERQTTVYAIELSISNPQGKLIPGMPTDVAFAK